jgi:hypothetical protein
MNKMTFLFSLFLTSTFFISCSDNSASKKSIQSENNVTSLPASQQVDTTYMPTGFYFLTDEKNDGIRMKDESSGDYYSLAKAPFASVTNIKQTELKTTKLEQGDYTELCMTFDNKGTKDLGDGTGNSLHSKIAVVIVGKLLYVVDNTTKIKTGVMCVGLVGYSKEQMTEIKKAVDQKN